MDGSYFDAWTRRRFGLAAGGLVGSLGALAGRGDAAAKKKRKKRCKRLRQACTLGRKRQRCCQGRGLFCDEVFALPDGQTHCCHEAGGTCADNRDCCRQGQCVLVTQRCAD
jgi:hypothetical protein